MSEELPYYIQKAIELGLLEQTEHGLRSTSDGGHLSAMEVARIVDKLQPSSVQEREDTTPQEAIVLSRVLASSSARARELWAALRSAFGVMLDQSVPPVLWSDARFRAIAHEIDMVFIGQSDTSVISRDSLAVAYTMRQEASRIVPVTDFSQAIHELADPSLMESYGDPDTEWDTALDVLKRFRVRALYLDTLHVAKQNIRAESKLEDALEFLQHRSTECLGIVRGTIGSQGRFVDAIDSIVGQPVDGADNWIDSIMKERKPQRPISTGVYAMDLDCGGGVMPHGPAQHKYRMLLLAARPAVGKTALASHAATSIVLGGATVAFISAELEREATEARLFASLVRKTVGVSGVHWSNASDGIGYVDATELIYHRLLPKPGLERVLMAMAEEMKASGGRLLTEAPQKPCAHAIAQSIRVIKARRPELRVVVIDHFHAIKRHKGAPRDETAMLSERAEILDAVCKELAVDLILTCQMNREKLDDATYWAKGQEPPPPTQSQIRGTDVLAHNAHCVWLCRKRPVQGGEPSENMIEIWHDKVREGQIIWGSDASGNPTMRPVRGGSVDRSIIQIDYNTCTLKGDDTINHPAVVKARRLLN